MEKRDLYDRDKENTQFTIFKEQETPDNYYTLVVLALIQNSKNEILVQKRSIQKGGEYGLTSGHPKSGETSLSGIISEIKEELGVEALPQELNLMYSTRDDNNRCFYDLYYLKKDYEKENMLLQKDRNMEFVIHRVSPEYFTAPFVGTLAVYNTGDRPGIRIELQEVTKDLVASIDKGKRPRDWEACLILDYEFLSKSPKILKKSPNLNMDFLKYPIVVIHEVGEQIFELYEHSGQESETYTRFNIYNLGQVILDDHRSKESFMENYKFFPESVRISNIKKSKEIEEEIEL